MESITPYIGHADLVEDVGGFFFRYQGGIQFKRPGGDLTRNPSGNARVIQSCPRFGLTVFSDLSGFDQNTYLRQSQMKILVQISLLRADAYVVRTSDLLAKASKEVGNEK